MILLLSTTAKINVPLRDSKSEANVKRLHIYSHLALSDDMAQVPAIKVQNDSLRVTREWLLPIAVNDISSVVATTVYL